MKRTNIIASTVVVLLAVTAGAQTKKPRSAAEQAKLDRYNETYNAELDARLKTGMSFEQAEAEAYNIGKKEHDGRGSEVEQLKIVKKAAPPKIEVKKAVAPVSTATSAQTAAPAAIKPGIAKEAAPAKLPAVKQEPKPESAAKAPPVTEPSSSGTAWVNPPDKKPEVAAQDKQSVRSQGWVDVPEKKPGDSDKMKAAIIMKERAEAKLLEVTSCKEKLTNGGRIDKINGARTLLSEAKAMVPTLDVTKLDTDLGAAMSASTQKEDYCDRAARLKKEAGEKIAAESGVDRSNVRVVGPKGPVYNTSYTPEGKKGVAGSVRID